MGTQKSIRRYRAIADQIIQRITSGVYCAGDRLPSERDLVDELGVSRPTLREAIIALEIMGYVAVRERSGIYVLGPEHAHPEVDLGIGTFELLEARRVVEADVAAIAAGNITNDQLYQLREYIDRQIKGQDEKSDLFESADRLFHTAIAEATGNGALIFMVDALWNFRRESDIWRILDQHSGVEAMRERAIDDHVKIYAALELRDPAASARAMADHIQHNIDWRLAGSLRDNPVSDADRRTQLRLRVDREKRRTAGAATKRT